MRRREFIGLVSAACVSVSPLTARAQRPAPAKIGFLGGTSSTVGQTLLSCFLSGLRNRGWTEGRDFKLEVRWTEGIVDRYSQFAAELVSLNPDVIVATSTPGAKAAQRATTRIPVVFVAVSDPVASGVVVEFGPSRRKHHRRIKFSAFNHRQIDRVAEDGGPEPRALLRAA